MKTVDTTKLQLIDYYAVLTNWYSAFRQILLLDGGITGRGSDRLGSFYVNDKNDLFNYCDGDTVDRVIWWNGQTWQEVDYEGIET